MILTPKQKAYLRSLAQTEKAKFQCGKDGLSDTFIELIQNAFHTRELIKNQKWFRSLVVKWCCIKP